MHKILIVIARLNKGGTAAYISELVKQLPKKKYEVLIATGYVQGSEIEDESAKSLPIVRIKHLGRKISPINDLRARLELRKVIESFKPHLIYSHTFKAGLLTRTLNVEAPIIHAFHGHLLDEPELVGIKVKIATLIERKLAKRAKYLVTVGEKVAIDLLNVGVGKPEQYFSIPPGVNPLKLESKSRARRELGILKEKRPIVVWMARVVAVKSPERVIELAKAIPDARFLLAGGGNLLDQINEFAPKNLTVLGWQSAERMWAVADLAISTSKNEGMPIALIEAQMSGIPIVAMNVGSVSEVVKNKVTGFVYNEFDDSFIEGTKKIAFDSKLRARLSRNALKKSQKLFSPKLMVKKHQQLFKKVL
jgi:glycosyltransferase involved in cell wall biosynthesis